MNLHALKACAFSFALLLYLCGCSDNGLTTTPSIRVTAPASQSVVDAGATCDIRWSSAGSVDNTVRIDLYGDTGFVQTVVSAAPNSGSFSWPVLLQVPGDTASRIKITSATQPSVYGYSGYFTIVNNTDAYEPDGSPSLATMIDTNGQAQKHRISTPDTDWFKFEATSGRTYCIQTHGNADTYLWLYATNALTLLASNDNGGVAGNALIVWTCGGGVSSGTYYFRVTAPPRSAGADYSIDIRPGSAVLAITSPVSGTIGLTSGSAVSIRWAYSTNSGPTASLYAFRNDSPAYTIVAGTANDGSYSWTIPWTLPTSQAYRIKIVCDNDTSIHDQSDQFAITRIPVSLTITTPTSSTGWNTGTSYAIYWAYSGNFGSYVKLDLYDSSSYVMTITGSGYLRNGSLDWTVPYSLASASTYRIRISSTADTSITDFSAPFTITKIPTTLTVTTPSAASNWNSGSTYAMTWTYAGNPGPYIALSLWDSAASSQIAAITGAGAAAGGTYSWTVPPTIASGTYRIKINSSQDTTIYNYSSYFKIAYVPTTIIVTTPGASAVWNTGVAYSVYWSFTGSIGAYVTISLYNDSTFVQTLNSYALSSYGGYQWTIPTTLPGGSKYRIKVASYSYPSIAGYSGYFTLVQAPSRLTITIPGTTSSWNTGTSCSIYWTSGGPVGPTARIDLYDSSRFVQSISSSASVAGGYLSWLVPSSLHSDNQYRVKITSTTQDTVFGMSGFFTITNIPAGIIVTAPATGDRWNAGAAYNVGWSSNGTVPGSYVSISLMDSSGLITPVVSSAYRTYNAYSGTLPITQRGGNNVRIRVASTTDTTIAGYSGLFAIVPAPPRLTITSPDTLTSWTAGYSYTIYWSYSGSAGTNVKIDLYDSSTLVRSIAPSVYTTDGSLLWLVPSTLQSDARYRIKITSAATDTVFGFSKYFQLVNSAVGDSYEPDSTYALARPIVAGAPAQSHTLTSNDRDWFSFAATAGTTYTIETFGSSDTYMNLFSNNGANLISSNDDESGTNTNAKITWTCTVSGTYYFEITGSYGATGSYTVSLN
jgi:Ser-Thr-rich glycosyl-phosphatidyl-inositol-anchored membrane family/Bacterial pre-peptidase C-terminal domain